MALIKPGQLRSGSYSISGSFSGSFYGDGSGLSNLPVPIVNTSSLVTTSSFNAFTSSINSFTASYTTGSFTGSFTGTVTGTASFATTASYVSSNFQYEIHVSQVDGNDTTGNGDLLKPVATIGKALLLVSASVASTDRRTIIVHPGTYIENITINTTNTYFFSTGVLGANCLISGSVTISAATRMSGIKMTNLIVSSSNPIYMNNCAVDKQMTVSGSGYLEVQNTSLQCTSGIQVVGPASSGVIFENCSLYPLTVNNASAAVYVISCNQAITPTLTAGALTITRSTISSLTSGATSTALTTAAGSVLVLESCNVYNSLLTSHAAITANGFYSIKNVIYNRSASTLASLSGTGGPLATVSQFQYINADNINSTQGLTVTGSITVSGSVINNLTASYASLAVSSSFATTAQTASYVLNSISSSFATSSSFAVSASRAVTSSFALTASYVAGASSFPYTGSALITGSLGVTGSVSITQNVTSSRTFISSSNGTVSGSTLTVYGSGSAQPVFTVQGSQGELFSVTDSLSGSLFSVNDISGLPILEVFSDNTTLIGNYLDPMLITTAKVTQTNSGSFVLYSLPTASYDTAFFEYSVKSGSNARAGTIMAIQSGASVNFTEVTSSQFGSTSAISFTVIVTGSNMALTGSSTSGAWTIKTIVRGL
jgi:hypothetical protein